MVAVVGAAVRELTVLEGAVPEHERSRAGLRNVTELILGMIFLAANLVLPTGLVLTAVHL